MKRTKNMIYKPTVESRELVLVATNDCDLYRKVAIPCIKNLNRKYKKGLYEPDKAVDLWYNLACRASEQYKKDFGYGFSVTDRFTAAVEIEEHYREAVENGLF